MFKFQGLKKIIEGIEFIPKLSHAK